MLGQALYLGFVCLASWFIQRQQALLAQLGAAACACVAALALGLLMGQA